MYLQSSNIQRKKRVSFQRHCDLLTLQRQDSHPDVLQWCGESHSCPIRLDPSRWRKWNRMSWIPREHDNERVVHDERRRHRCHFRLRLDRIVAKQNLIDSSSRKSTKKNCNFPSWSDHPPWHLKVAYASCGVACEIILLREVSRDLERCRWCGPSFCSLPRRN